MVNSKVTILIAEDEYITAMDFKNTLQNMGCIVSAIVSSGEDLVEYINKETPTLIIADINLKGELDGIEAIARIQEKHDIPFIYVTAYRDFERVVQIYNLKPCEYLLKPIQSSMLEESVKACLSQLDLDWDNKKK
ncbi:MAG: response regulator [Ignavibacteriaceae bacterium]